MFSALEAAGALGPATLLKSLVSPDERADWNAMFCPPVMTNAELRTRLGPTLGAGSFMTAYEDLLNHLHRPKKLKTARTMPSELDGRVIGQAHESFTASTCENDDDESWNLEHMVTSIRAGILFRKGNSGYASPYVVAVEHFSFVVHEDGSACFLLMMRQFDSSLRRSPMLPNARRNYRLASKMCYSLVQSILAVRNEGMFQNDSGPANVGVTVEHDADADGELPEDNYRIKVQMCDFGSAKRIGSRTLPLSYKNPCYMSPEELDASRLCRNYVVDDAAISWSAGFLLLYILRGGRPVFKERPPALPSGTKQGKIDVAWREQVAAEHKRFMINYSAKRKAAELKEKGGNAWTLAAYMLMDPNPRKRYKLDDIWAIVNLSPTAPHSVSLASLLTNVPQELEEKSDSDI